MKIEKVEPEALGSEFRTQKQGSMCIQWHSRYWRLVACIIYLCIWEKASRSKQEWKVEKAYLKEEIKGEERKNLF